MRLERRLGLKEDEKLLAASRASLATMALPAAAVLLLVLAPLFFLTPLLHFKIFGLAAIGAAEALGFLLGLRGLVKWTGTVFAITDRRLISVRRGGFFDRHATELPLSRIQEVSYRVSGLAPTLFRYGTLRVQSSGGDGALEIDRVPHPSRLQTLVAELQEASSRGAGDFGEMLQAVSRLDRRRLQLLRSEIERAERFLPPADPRAL